MLQKLCIVFFILILTAKAKKKKKLRLKVTIPKKEALKTSIQGYIAANEGMKNREKTNHILLESNFKKLLIIGEKDPVLDFQTSLEEAKKTNSDFVVYPDGHMSHIENTSELIATLKRFIKSC